MKVSLYSVLIICFSLTLPIFAGDKEEYHRVHVAGFLGASHNGEMNAFTFGGDLEYRFSRPVGIAFTAEHVNQPFRENVWIFPFVVHPVKGVRLSLGPGFERAREEGEIVQRKLFRLGGSYDFELKHGWTIGPDVAVDFVNGEKVFVYGIAIGKGFAAKH